MCTELDLEGGETSGRAESKAHERELDSSRCRMWYARDVMGWEGAYSSKESPLQGCEPVWPSGKAGKQKDLASIPLRLSFLFKKVVVGGLTLLCDFVPHN